MKKGFLILSVASLVLTFFSCSKSSSPEPDACGTAINNDKVFPASSAIVFDNSQWTESNILTTINGSERSFIIMTKQEALCPQKLVGVSYKVNTSNGAGTPLATDIKGRVEWGEGLNKETTCCKKSDGNLKSNYAYSSDLSVDIKEAFKDKPGNVKSTLTISFHTLGSTSLDTSYFRNKFQDMRINVAGYRSK